MNSAATPALDDLQTLRLLPRWVISARGEDVETVAFSSGAALGLLDVVLRDPGDTLPAPLLRDRLAMEAAVACLKVEGRNDSLSDIRDAVCLARAGESFGPAGEMFMAWRRAARINLRVSSWRGQVMKGFPDQVVEAMPDVGRLEGSPVGQAGLVLAEFLHRFPRQEAAALMLADVTLARAVGWEQPVPLLAAQLKRADVRAIADGAEDTLLRVHRAVIAACDAAIRQCADLSRRATKLRDVAPKLRARGAGEALGLFLSHDAVSPSGMLSPTIQGSGVAMTDRAARRLCDRLVDLGVVRELTGRSTFRLYGI